jgi:hypothetical protein
MKIIPKILDDPKHIAWASWAILSNNPVSKSLYLIFCLFDLLLIMYYSFNLTQRVHFSNFDFDTITGYNSSSNVEMFEV